MRSARRVALAGLALALVGFAFVGPPLSAPGAALCLLGGLAELSVRLAATRVTLTARNLRGTVIEGEPLSLEIVVRSSWLIGLAGPRLRHPLLEGTQRLRTVSTQVHARTRRRGRMVLAPPQLELSDPLGLARAVCGGGGSVGELLVLPRTQPVSWLGDDTAGAAVSAASALAGREATDITGLAEYQPGTPASRIHWPALARGGDLLERVFASETQLPPLVVLDARTTESRSGRERLDAVIRATASLSLALARAGAVDLLLPGHRTPVRISASLTGWPSVHRALALVQEAPLDGAAPVLPRDSPGVLFYAASDLALVGEAARRRPGRLWTLTPRLPGAVLSPGRSELAECLLSPHAGGA